MRRLGFIIVVACVVPLAAAQEPDQKRVRQELKAQAEKIGKAMVEDKHEQLIDGTHPKIVEMIGGRAKMLEILEKLSKQMQAQFPMRTVKMEESSDLVSNKGTLFGIVPFTLELKSATKSASQPSFLIGVSVDAGKTWKFVDAGGKRRDDLKKVMPDLPENLKFPKLSPPKYEKLP